MFGARTQQVLLGHTSKIEARWALSGRSEACQANPHTVRVPNVHLSIFRGDGCVSFFWVLLLAGYLLRSMKLVPHEELQKLRVEDGHNYRCDRLPLCKQLLGCAALRIMKPKCKKLVDLNVYPLLS